MKPICTILFLVILVGGAYADDSNSGAPRIYDPFDSASLPRELSEAELAELRGHMSGLCVGMVSPSQRCIETAKCRLEQKKTGRISDQCDAIFNEEWERTKRLYDPANMKPQHLCDNWDGVDDDLVGLCNAKADRLARKHHAGKIDFDTYQVGVKELQVEMVEAQRRRRLERYETLHGPRGDRAETRCEPDGRGIRCVTR